jgi:flagellar basal-body rod modification protein FlgD
MVACSAPAAGSTSAYEAKTMTISTTAATASSLSATPTTSASGSTLSGSDQTKINNQIAGNFNTFLQLLTTQLKNQNPLEPLDTNQFTQQLVQFAGVEQQINMNTQLQTLVGLQQTAQNTQALGFVGKTVTVTGATAPLTNGQAQWTFNPPSPAKATFTISDSTGQTVFSQTGTVQPGVQQFNWNGLDNAGRQWADGNYKLTITATGANGQSVAIPTTITGTVDSVDLTHSPPLLSIGGQTYTLNQILSVVQPLSSLSSVGSSLSGIGNSLTGLF